MNNLIYEINYYLSDWKKQYDITDSVGLEAILDEQDQIYINLSHLCSAQGLILDTVESNIESLVFHFAGNFCLRITFTWPEDEPPRVGAVYFGHDTDKMLL